MITNSKKDEVKIWIRHEKSRYKHAFRIRLGTKMHKLFNAWCRRFGGGKPVTAFRFFFKGKLIDGEQTAADIEYNPRTRPGRPPTIINVTSLPEVTLPITRSNSKKIRENVRRRLPHEVEATLSSWVKCTDPIPREILEEVRSTFLVWMKNVENYVEETETYILNDEHVHQEIVDEGWGWVDVLYPYSLLRKNSGTLSRVETSRIAGFRRRAWSRLIREMLLSDVNIIHRGVYPGNVDFDKIEIVFERLHAVHSHSLVVYFHERLSSEIKDEISSKLASALRALKSRISRICGINELERRTQSH